MRHTCFHIRGTMNEAEASADIAPCARKTFEPPNLDHLPYTLRLTLGSMAPERTSDGLRPLRVDQKWEQSRSAAGEFTTVKPDVDGESIKLRWRNPDKNQQD